ncbi:MAG: ATPase [Clostridia bacterium]|nr:ATPase [Clostridia bacterium]
MNFEEIINAMEDLVENSWSLPLSGGKSVVDSAQILEFIEDMRIALPEEIKRARQIMAQRDDILSRAKNESEAIINAANAQAQKMVSSQEVYRLAQQKANEIVTAAQNSAKEMRTSAIRYCDGLLEQSEETVRSSLAALQETRKNLRK